MSKDESAVTENELVVSDNTASESATEVNHESDEEITLDKSEQQEDESKEDVESQDETSEESEKPKKGAEKRIEQLDEEIAELEGQLDPKSDDYKEQAREAVASRLARRSQLMQQVKQRSEQQFSNPDVNQLLETVNPDTGDYFTPVEAKLALMERSQQIKQYNEQVADAQVQIEADADRVLKEMSMFDERSEDYNKELAEYADNAVKQGLQYDQAGNLVGSAVPIYQFYKSIASAYEAGSTKGAVNGRKAVQQMRNRVDPGSRAAQTENKEDEFLKAFDENL